MLLLVVRRQVVKANGRLVKRLSKENIHPVVRQACETARAVTMTILIYLGSGKKKVPPLLPLYSDKT